MCFWNRLVSKTLEVDQSTTCAHNALELNSHYQEKCLHGCFGLQAFSVSYGQVYSAIKDSLKQTARQCTETSLRSQRKETVAGHSPWWKALVLM